MRLVHCLVLGLVTVVETSAQPPARSEAQPVCGEAKAPMRSKCLAERHNKDVRDANGQPVRYDFFGANDPQAGRLRSLDSVSLVVIHNGGNSAAANVKTWQSRGTSAHYTIQRDGKIFQHVGEERVAWHAKGANAESIGIELNRGTFKAEG